MSGQPIADTANASSNASQPDWRSRCWRDRRSGIGYFLMLLGIYA